mmetsp:Transcript_30141/g.54629  ORF Transcript_30141/g.54629 Transcript_30141/m.54629 type:complete len:236 (+) Transcript_30141:81-788(+)
MIDTRAGLPQELSGDNLGLPCARLRPRPRKEPCGLPSVNFSVPEEKGFVLPGGNADLNPAMLAFTGTRPMPLAVARSRSEGCLKSGGPLDLALKARKYTDLDLLVDVLVKSAPDQRKDDLRYFKQPYNPHREKMASRFIDEEKRKKQVLQVLRKYPICDIYDLARVDERMWSDISRDLGGISYGVAMRSALQCVGQNFTPLERASFWAAVGNRQRITDRGRTCSIAAEDSPREMM